MNYGVLESYIFSGYNEGVIIGFMNKVFSSRNMLMIIIIFGCNFIFLLVV